jgi:hypothetical protein
MGFFDWLQDQFDPQWRARAADQDLFAELQKLRSAPVKPPAPGLGPVGPASFADDDLRQPPVGAQAFPETDPSADRLSMGVSWPNLVAKPAHLPGPAIGLELFEKAALPPPSAASPLVEPGSKLDRLQNHLAAMRQSKTGLFHPFDEQPAAADLGIQSPMAWGNFPSSGAVEDRANRVDENINRTLAMQPAQREWSRLSAISPDSLGARMAMAQPAPAPVQADNSPEAMEARRQRFANAMAEVAARTPRPPRTPEQEALLAENRANYLARRADDLAFRRDILRQRGLERGEFRHSGLTPAEQRVLGALGLAMPGQPQIPGGGGLGMQNPLLAGLAFGPEAAKLIQEANESAARQAFAREEMGQRRSLAEAENQTRINLAEQERLGNKEAAEMQLAKMQELARQAESADAARAAIAKEDEDRRHGERMRLAQLEYDLKMAQQQTEAETVRNAADPTKNAALTPRQLAELEFRTNMIGPAADRVLSVDYQDHLKRSGFLGLSPPTDERFIAEMSEKYVVPPQLILDWLQKPGGTAQAFKAGKATPAPRESAMDKLLRLDATTVGQW